MKVGLLIATACGVMMLGCSGDRDSPPAEQDVAPMLKWAYVDARALESALVERMAESDHELSSAMERRGSETYDLKAEISALEAVEKAACYEKTRENVRGRTDREILESLEYNSCVAYIYTNPKIQDLRRRDSEIQDSQKRAQLKKYEAAASAKTLAKKISEEYARRNGIDLLLSRDYASAVYYNNGNRVADVTADIIAQSVVLMDEEQQSN